MPATGVNCNDAAAGLAKVIREYTRGDHANAVKCSYGYIVPTVDCDTFVPIWNNMLKDSSAGVFSKCEITTPTTTATTTPTSTKQSTVSSRHVLLYALRPSEIQ